MRLGRRLGLRAIPRAGATPQAFFDGPGSPRDRLGPGAAILPSTSMALIQSDHRAPEVAWAPRSGIPASCRLGLGLANGNLSRQLGIDASTDDGLAVHPHRPPHALGRDHPDPLPPGGIAPLRRRPVALGGPRSRRATVLPTILFPPRQAGIFPRRPWFGLAEGEALRRRGAGVPRTSV
jgi:hypothetical protein